MWEWHSEKFPDLLIFARKRLEILASQRIAAGMGFVISRSGVRVTPLAPKCVDERCNAENAARKCGVFTYNAPLLE